MIAIGSDHAGFKLKETIISYFIENNIVHKDFGCYSNESVDYPVYAKKVADGIKNGECAKGILICGTGIGISMAANKIKGIYAALCTDCFAAQAARVHNDANVLVLGARITDKKLAIDIVEIFLTTEFSNEQRHIDRLNLVKKIESEEVTTAIKYRNKT